MGSCAILAVVDGQDQSESDYTLTRTTLTRPAYSQCPVVRSLLAVGTCNGARDHENGSLSCEASH